MHSTRVIDKKLLGNDMGCATKTKETRNKIMSSNKVVLIPMLSLKEGLNLCRVFIQIHPY